MKNSSMKSGIKRAAWVLICISLLFIGAVLAQEVTEPANQDGVESCAKAQNHEPLIFQEN